MVVLPVAWDGHAVRCGVCAYYVSLHLCIMLYRIIRIITCLKYYLSFKVACPHTSLHYILYSYTPQALTLFYFTIWVCKYFKFPKSNPLQIINIHNTHLHQTDPLTSIILCVIKEYIQWIWDIFRFLDLGLLSESPNLNTVLISAEW